MNMVKKNLDKDNIFLIEESLRNLYVDIKGKYIIQDSNTAILQEEKDKIENIDIDKLIKYLKEIIEISININIEREIYKETNNKKYKKNNKN
jgi:hypothetical protein